MVTKSLEMFKNLQISKDELSKVFGGNLLNAKTDNPVVISYRDVIHVLKTFKDGDISLTQLLDWVNTIWFTELYQYDEDHSDSIASVLTLLEELDEADKVLTASDIDKYIEALTNNQEI